MKKLISKNRWNKIAYGLAKYAWIGAGLSVLYMIITKWTGIGGTEYSLFALWICGMMFVTAIFPTYYSWKNLGTNIISLALLCIGLGAFPMFVLSFVFHFPIENIFVQIGGIMFALGVCGGIIGGVIMVMTGEE